MHYYYISVNISRERAVFFTTSSKYLSCVKICLPDMNTIKQTRCVHVRFDFNKI